MFQPGANLYTANTGTRPENIEVPHFDVRAPTAQDVLYPLAKWWVWPGNGVWELNQLSSAGGTLSATWIQLASGSGAIVQILGTANQITATTTNNITTLSIPSTFIAPGSIASTTTNNSGTSMTAGTFVAAGTSVTAGTTVTATLGNITATNGNFVASTSGTGLLFNSPTATGAAPGPIIVNGRSGQAIFTGVSIAAAADLTLTITNSAITGSATQIIYSMSGSTTGSAQSIKSVTNSAGSSAIVVTNGTGTTTTTADITLNFIVLN